MVSSTFRHPFEERPLRPALVLWGGYVGGAESFTVDLAQAMQLHGAEPAVVFVLQGAPLADRLDGFRIPHSALGLRRGRAVLHAPRRLARSVSTSEPDVAILVETGYLAAALRVGGYRAPIIGIEHGSILQSHSLGRVKRLIRAADRMSGTKACSVVVAVSDYMRERLIGRRLHTRVVCIPNGVDLTRFSPLEGRATRGEGGEIIIGCAARLIEGKGIEDLITALSHTSLDGARLRIAGEGPRAWALKVLARSLGVASRVEFLGRVLDMPSFWRGCDVAAMPSNNFVESFGMAAVEAMACARPVVATANGALPELVQDGVTGLVVPRGDIAAMRRAIAEYAHDPARRGRHGSCGRRRCEEHFSIERAASRYLELCAELVREGRQMRWS